MSADMLFEIGMMYSVGRDTPVDLISAHKWFNLAAVRGSTEAIRLRREVADQMSDAEIAVAQRRARLATRQSRYACAGLCDGGLSQSRRAHLARVVGSRRELVHPELIHSDECIGLLGLKAKPAIEIERRGGMRKARREALQCRGIAQQESGELQIIRRKKRLDFRQADAMLLHVKQQVTAFVHRIKVTQLRKRLGQRIVIGDEILRKRRISSGVDR